MSYYKITEERKVTYPRDREPALCAALPVFVEEARSAEQLVVHFLESLKQSSLTKYNRAITPFLGIFSGEITTVIPSL